MKILYISDTFGNISGAPKSATDVLINLLATNNPVTVLSTSNKIKLPQKVLGKVDNQLEWIKAPRNIPFPKQIDSKLPRNIAKWAVRGWQDLFRQNYLSKIRKINPDLIFVNSMGSHVLYSRFNFDTSKSVIIVRCSPTSFKFSDNYSILEYAVNVLEQYSTIIFVSSNVQDEWLSYKTLASKKTFYIPNCCEEDKVLCLQNKNRSEIRKHLGIPEDRFIIVCVANIFYRKGQDVLVENFINIKKFAPDIILFLVGKVLYPSNTWSKKLVRNIKNQNFGDSLQAIGNRSDALSFIYAADVLILPTRAEAMPRVILEAMALKTPVIATDVDGIPELIENEVDGLLIPPDNSEKLVGAIKWMYENKDERKKFAETAHKKYWSNFSRKLQMKRYQDILERI